MISTIFERIRRVQCKKRRKMLATKGCYGPDFNFPSLSGYLKIGTKLWTCQSEETLRMTEC